MRKILVVDDCSSTRALLKKLAWRWEIEAIAVENATDALDELSKPDAPQILLIDWVMPGMDGIELIQKIRETSKDEVRYIIMMTAKNGSEDIEAGFAAGADDYLVKPLEQNELRARIGEGEKVIFRTETIVDAIGQVKS